MSDIIWTPVPNNGYPAGANGGNMTAVELISYHAAQNGYSGDAVATISGYSANALANIADCGNDNDDAAEFLTSVRDAVVELTGGEIHAEDWDRVAQDRVLHDIADNAPSVYTGARWSQFTGLRAWSEDISDLGGDTADMTAAAGTALYIIADRLAMALVSEISAAIA